MFVVMVVSQCILISKMHAGSVTGRGTAQIPSKSREAPSLCRVENAVDSQATRRKEWASISYPCLKRFPHSLMAQKEMAAHLPSHK